MRFRWDSIKKPVLVLAPMSGYTDSAYRQLIKSVEPKTLLITEFVSADAIRYGADKTLSMLKFKKTEHPIICQVFGKRVENFVRAAKVIEDFGYDGIDINMGCPARKVIRSDHGSALAKIENQEKAFEIVEAMSKAVKIPISVKTRLGWKDDSHLLAFAKRLESSGCKCLMIHGRTTEQQYSGEADYKPIYKVKKELCIPVLGNGDIRSAFDAKEKLGNLDGLLVGRGTFGNPWVMKDIQYFFETGNVKESVVPWKKKILLIRRHCKLMVQVKGEERGIREMRKFLLMYFRGFTGAKDLRKKMIHVSNLEDVENILKVIK